MPPTDFASAPTDPAFPGAVRPHRRRTIDAHGVAVSMVEWGDESSPPVVFAHGGFDFAETFNVFAPLLAARGWRVVSWDHRGHGHSEWATLYSVEADLRDAMAVLDHVGPAPVPMVGHSKGGAISLHLADAAPHRIRSLVNLDGIPSRSSLPDIAEHERTRMLASEISGWLDHRRSVLNKARRPGTVAELAERRGRMNPRLSPEWLRYLVQVGGREDTDGWRWRIDPTLRMGGFGPWRPEWTILRVPALGMPFLAVLGTETEVMGWGTRPADVARHLPPQGRMEVIDDVGHFLHIEAPHAMADLIADFLGAPR